ncbi:DUF6179 domain-containing protein [uncultured Clostridium sp.]|uniref:DUF6179 domain-containing protein n=1 Tax=uncultured Clostridium sp. TaxID=59620 RepID=UPI0025D384C2|nr:DUF6179 domain-containing protein [uncultured Clostridium sp.]
MNTEGSGNKIIKSCYGSSTEENMHGDMIEKYDDLLNGIINEEFFFKDILVKFYENSMIGDYIVSRINGERIAVLKEHLKYYTKDESSSVMEEDAEKILNGIDYTIGIYIKQSFAEDRKYRKFKEDHRSLLLDKLINEKLSYIVKKGHEIIKKKVLESRELFIKICSNKLEADNFSYHDTIDRGLGIFFKAYDDFFEPQEAPCSVDYQLCNDDIRCVGVEYIEKYLTILNMENNFCRKFPISEINEVLKGYDSKCELLLINIFELVLVNSIGRIICGKNLASLDISESDRKNIYKMLNKLSADEIREYINECSEECLSVLDIEDKGEQQYVLKSAAKVSEHIYNCIKINKLDRVFVSFRSNEDEEFIEFVDKEKVSNSRFRKITEHIRNSLQTEEKIQYIRDNIKSLQDMVDMLEADCLFGNEYHIFFKSISDFEKVLLLKHMQDFDLWDSCHKEWQEQFKKYLYNLTSEEYNSILKSVEKVRII